MILCVDPGGKHSGVTSLVGENDPRGPAPRDEVMEEME